MSSTCFASLHHCCINDIFHAASTAQSPSILLPSPLSLQMLFVVVILVLVILHHYIPVVTALVPRLTTGSAQGSALTLVTIVTLMLVWCVAVVRERERETETERGRKEDGNNYQLIIA